MSLSSLATLYPPRRIQWLRRRKPHPYWHPLNRVSILKRVLNQGQLKWEGTLLSLHLQGPLRGESRQNLLHKVSTQLCSQKFIKFCCTFRFFSWCISSKCRDAAPLLSIPLPQTPIFSLNSSEDVLIDNHAFSNYPSLQLGEEPTLSLGSPKEVNTLEEQDSLSNLNSKNCPIIRNFS